MNLRETLAAIAEQEIAAGGRRSGFLVPLRWATARRVRCENGHVHVGAMRPDHADAGSFCIRPKCRAPAALTFPEDRSGPLCAPSTPSCTPKSGIATR